MKQLFEDIFDEIDDEDLVEQPEDIQATNTFPYLFTIYLEDPDHSFPDIIIKKNIKFFNYIFSQTTFIKEFTPVEYSTDINAYGSTEHFKSIDGYKATFDIAGKPSIGQVERFVISLIRHMEKTHRECKAKMTFYKDRVCSTVYDLFNKRQPDDQKYFYEDIVELMHLFGIDNVKIGEYAKKHGYMMSAETPFSQLDKTKGCDGTLFVPDFDFIDKEYNYSIHFIGLMKEDVTTVNKDDELYPTILEWMKGRPVLSHQAKRYSDIIRLLFVDTFMMNGVDHVVKLVASSSKMSSDKLSEFNSRLDIYKTKNPVNWKNLI